MISGSKYCISGEQSECSESWCPQMRERACLLGPCPHQMGCVLVGSIACFSGYAPSLVYRINAFDCEGTMYDTADECG